MNDFLRVPLHTLSAQPAGPGCVIDCDTCAVRGDACTDCVVSVMLGGPPDVVAPEGERALGVLAGLGLVPPLLMTPPEAGASPAPPVRLTAPGAGASPPAPPVLMTPPEGGASPPAPPGVEPP